MYYWTWALLHVLLDVGITTCTIGCGFLFLCEEGVLAYVGDSDLKVLSTADSILNLQIELR